MSLRISFKKSKLLRSAFATLIYLYLKLVYASCRWVILAEDSADKESLKRGALFALWHNQLAFGAGIFTRLGIQNISGLISSHSDGRLIASVITKFNFPVIAGSTSKGAFGALRKIISELKSGNNVLITPDGPRGPALKVGGNITTIAHRYGANLVPISCKAKAFFALSSWDKLIIPVPFTTITVRIHQPLNLTGNKAIDDAKLEKILSNFYK